MREKIVLVLVVVLVVGCFNVRERGRRRGRRQFPKEGKPLLQFLSLTLLIWTWTQTAPASLLSTTYRVPYRLSETRHIIVRAKLNGRGPFNFIMDTGAPALFVSKEVAQKVGVTPGADGWGTFDRLEVEGGAVVEKIKGRTEELFQLQGMNAMGLAGTRLDGVFGYNVLARFRIEIDLTQPTMTWTKLDYEPPPPQGLRELMGDKPVPPPPDLPAMEGFAKLASTLFPRQTEDEVVTRGFFGIELSDVSDGVRVQAVLPKSPAAQAGLKAGDRFTRLGLQGRLPQRVQSSADVLRLTANVAAGEVVRFTVVRGNKTVPMSVRAGKGGL